MIATVLALLIFALLISVAVSLITTGANIGVQELQGQQAFNIAEGGIEYILENRTFPNYSLTAAKNLGAGSFIVFTPTYLTGAVAIGNNTINVNSTTGSASPAGRLVIDSEVIAYTGTTANSFTGAGPATAAHTNGNAVYPVTTVIPNPIAIGDTTINVASTTGFVIPGILNIDSENIYCANTNAPSTTQFTNCTRGYNSTPAAAHPAGNNVFQYMFRSKGVISSNPLANPTQRIVRADMTSRIRSTPIGWTLAASKNWALGAMPIRPISDNSIAFDSTTSGAANTVNTITWSHTTSGSNRILVVGLSIRNNISVSTVTYAGQALTRAGFLSHPGPGNIIRVELWYLVNPSSGAYNVIVNMSAMSSFIYGAVSLTGVDQINPLDSQAVFGYGTGNNASANVSIATPNAWVVDTIASEPTNVTPFAGQTQQWTRNIGGVIRGGGSTAGPMFSASAGTMKVMMNEVF
ncbi:MAG: hypothetical protein HY755_01525 [Nitrospirae bacterium]|nr:hypothetical protein [Nitrospirota bacterium]